MGSGILLDFGDVLSRDEAFVFESSSLWLRIASNIWIPVLRSGNVYVYNVTISYISTAGNIIKRISGKASAFALNTFQKDIFGIAKEPIIPDDNWNSFESIKNAMLIGIRQSGASEMFTIRQYTAKEIAELELRANLDYMMMMNDTLSITSTTPVSEYYEKLANIPEDMRSSRTASTSDTTETKAFHSRKEIFKLYYQMGLFSKDQVYNLYAKDKISSQVYTYITGMPPPA